MIRRVHDTVMTEMIQYGTVQTGPQGLASHSNTLSLGLVLVLVGSSKHTWLGIQRRKRRALVLVTWREGVPIGKRRWDSSNEPFVDSSFMRSDVRRARHGAFCVVFLAKCA
jgi:hypothetical protein